MEAWVRFERLIGEPALRRLQGSHVLVLGVGGVGGHCVDALARCGIGSFTLADPDVVAPSNLNRQMVALHSTLGMPKVEVMRARIADINPNAKVRAVQGRFPACEDLFEPRPDCIVDAIDDVKAKIALAVWASEHRVPMVSSMGAGNKLDPTRFEVADIFETSVCPLCRAVRTRLRKTGVSSLRVVYSKEQPILSTTKAEGPGSIVTVTASAGLILANETVRALLHYEQSANF
ncbi:MAG TPA: tRNA threonylcarbamoyladenosine dehydratase [Clostridia bacterium]|nr:tRNA threonylcarbamoyladenosine dehydratase [Clostridia bacterium]